MPDHNPIGDSGQFITAEAYELLDYLYYAWGVYNEKNREQEPKRGYKSLSAMENDQEQPCINCMSRELCIDDGYECSHFKQWASKGKYDPKSCSWK